MNGTLMDGMIWKLYAHRQDILPLELIVTQ